MNKSTNTQFPAGVWPTMLTPFTNENKIDYDVLEKQIEWYIDKGIDGLFAVCQSSEMFFLSLDERVELARFIVSAANKRVPVIASGHISKSIEEQIFELNEMINTGIDALILITNRFADQNESNNVWKKNFDTIFASLPEDIALGLYECPYPYKRVLEADLISHCADTNRFYFLKDTCCDIDLIKTKLDLIKDNRLELYNANTATLLESLKMGAAGYSGVMANFHPELYVWLTKNYLNYSIEAEEIQELLTVCSLIEVHQYPMIAKYYMRLNGIDFDLKTRCIKGNLQKVYKHEANQLFALSKRIIEKLL